MDPNNPAVTLPRAAHEGEIVNAPAGLPFLQKDARGATGGTLVTDVNPPVADIVKWGKGGGSESGGTFDPIASHEES